VCIKGVYASFENKPHALSAAAKTKPCIAVIALGGTIAMTPDQSAGGVVPSLSAAEFAAWRSMQ